MRELHSSCKELGINDSHITIIDNRYGKQRNLYIVPTILYNFILF